MTVVPAAAPEPVPVPADRVAAAVLAVPGVTGLHGGTFGIGTYLPGRRVTGIRLGDEVAEVHVTVAMGVRVPAVAEAIVGAVGPFVHTPVDVYVEDVTPAEPTTRSTS